MERLKKILKTNSGTSIVLTLCLTLLLFAIGVSVLAASADAAGANTRRQQSEIRFYYAKSLADYLTGQITAPFDIDPANPWTAIPQAAYDLNPDGMGSDRLQIANFMINIDDPGVDSWIESPDSTEYSITIDSQTVMQKQPYLPEQPAIGNPDDEGYVPAVPAVPEEAELELLITVEIATYYADDPYLLLAHYKFSGTALGDAATGGKGKINSGKWILLGYSQE